MPKKRRNEATRKWLPNEYSARDSRQFRAKLPGPCAHWPRAFLLSLPSISLRCSLSLSLFFALTPRTLFTVISLPRTFVASRRRHIVRLCMKSPLTFVSRAATKKSIHERSHAYSSNISNGLLLILKLDGPLIKLHCYTAVEQKAACLRVRLHAVSPSLYKVHRGKDYLAMRY